MLRALFHTHIQQIAEKEHICEHSALQIALKKRMFFLLLSRTKTSHRTNCLHTIKKKRKISMQSRIGKKQTLVSTIAVIDGSGRVLFMLVVPHI